MSELDEIKAVAKVEMNSSIALVLNRNPVYKYERHENLLYANDGGFVSVYRYDRPTKAFQAFGGREFYLDLVDGGKMHCHGQWWDGGLPELSSLMDVTFCHVPYNTLDRLKNCYVFYGGSSIIKDHYERLIDECDGPVYPYWDYEKLIKYDDLKRKCFDQKRYFERVKKNLIAEARKHKQALELLEG